MNKDYFLLNNLKRNKMKNKKILPNTLVPKKLRLKLYKKVHEDIINETPLAIGLCVSLPMHLWGLKECYENAPNGEEWNTYDTPNMFPELAEELSRLNIIRGFMNPNDRIAFLERILNEDATNKTISTKKRKR